MHNFLINSNMSNFIDKVIKELENKNFKQAVFYCNELIKIHPDNCLIYEIKGTCLFELGDYNEAAESFNKAINLVSGEKEYKDLHILYNKRGKTYLALGIAEKAEKDFNTSLNIKPDFAESYFNRGKLFYLFKNDKGKAEEEWYKAISIDQTYQSKVKNFKDNPPPVPSTEVVSENNQADLSVRETIDEEKDVFEIPDMSFREIFKEVGNQNEEDNVSDPDKGFIEGKEIISPDAKKLHDEISGKKDLKTKFVPENEPLKKKSIFLSFEFLLPVALVISLILFILIFRLYVDRTSAPEKKQDVSAVSNEISVKDSLINIGYVSDKKNFILLKNSEGYFVQIGSFKEKSKAEDRIKILKNENLPFEIVEINIEGKGNYYRALAGKFGSEQEAKEKISVILE